MDITSNVMNKDNIVSSDTSEINIDPAFAAKFNLTDFDLTLLEASVRTDMGMTDYQCQHFVANSQITPYKQVRQALMELEVRYHAYHEIRASLRKAEIMRLKMLQTQAQMDDPLDRELVQIDLDKADYDITIYKRKFNQSEREINSFLSVIKQHAKTPEELEKFTKDDPVEERNYWIARMGKQAALDIIAFGRVGSGNMDSIAMMDKEGQLAALQMAIEYSGLVQAGMSKISMDAQTKVDKYLKSDLNDIAQLYDPTKNLQLAPESKVNSTAI